MNTITATPTQTSTGPSAGTLLHHEFIRTRGTLAVIMGGATLFTLVGTLAALTKLPVLLALGLLLAGVGAGSLAPLTLIALTIDYWRSAYGRVGYLTHTLPVRGSTLYFIRLLYGSVVGIVATVWSLVLGLLPAYALAHAAVAPEQSALALLQDKLTAIFTVFTPLWWLVFAALAVVTLVSYVAQYYFAASVGSEGRLANLGPAGPVLVWFAVYLVMQPLAVIGMFALPVGVGVTDGSLGIIRIDMWAAAVSGEPTPDALPLGFLLPIVVASALMVWRTAYSWNHKVSLR